MLGSGSSFIRLAGQTNVSIGSINYDSWDLIEIEWGGINGTCTSTQVRGRVNGGAFSSCVEMNTGNDPIGLTMTGGGSSIQTFWVDELSFTGMELPAGAAAPTNLLSDIFWSIF